MENSLRFHRRDQLDPTWLTRGFPPWKSACEESYIGGVDVLFFDFLRRCAKEGRVVKTAPEQIVPSTFFSTIQEELTDLNTKLSYVTGRRDPPCILFLIDLPQFVGDPESEETRQLVKKYTEQRIYLMNLLCEKKFIEKVLDKFYSTDGDEG